jgi:hypothetical protein
VQAGPIRYLAAVLMEVDMLPADWLHAVVSLILCFGGN